MSQNYTYTTSNKQSLEITTYGNSNISNGNCIIFVHGFKGFKDWGFGPFLAEKMASLGNFVITFNFSHNGVGSNTTEFTELDKFAKNTYSREVFEINEIINAYKNDFFGVYNFNGKIGLLGHSRGGGVSIIAAEKNSDIDVLVTWSAISKFDRYTERQKKEWNDKGFLEIINSRTNQVMRLNKSLLEDIEENKESLDIEASASKLEIPFLIIHGNQDLAVPVKEANDIYSWSNKALTELYIISGTGHTFDIKHPFDGTTKAFENILDKTIGFFNKHFSEN